MSADRRRDKQNIAVLRDAIIMGYTHLDTAEMYGAGHTEELIGQAIKSFEREKLFITTKVSPSHLTYQGVLDAMHRSLRRLGTDYVDLYLIHWPSSRVPLSESFKALNELVRQGKTRHLGVSNFDLNELQESQAASETPIATNQVPFSLRSREYARNGVLEYCQSQGILVTAYSPVKTVNLKDASLREIARRYGATPAQIALSWVMHQAKVITIPKSSDRARLRENLESQAIRLSDEDRARLDALGR